MYANLGYSLLHRDSHRGERLRLVAFWLLNVNGKGGKNGEWVLEHGQQSVHIVMALDDQSSLYGLVKLELDFHE